MTSLVFAGLIAIATPVQANNVDLSTLPKREGVQLTIYNSADLTLVRETRRVSFKPGRNVMQFSWTNTRIDPTSVQLRFLERAGDLELVDTMFPHAKPQMLYWNVESEAAVDALVEVSYFTAGISWEADYVAVADEEARTMRLESFVRVRNQSGEDYENAKVRLVVGSLNLVQRIAALAGVPAGTVTAMPQNELSGLKVKAARRAMEDESRLMFDMATGDSGGGVPKTVSKESLSEYYLFSVSGRETVPNGWSKRLRSFSADKVPYRVVHRYRPKQYGNDLVRLFVTKNDKASGMGGAPLPDGTVRVLAQEKDGGLAYRGQQSIRYVPIGEDLEILLGKDPQVIFELVPQEAWRDEFVFHNSNVVGWDEHVVYAQRIRNYSKAPLELEIRRAFGGDAEFASQLSTKKHDLHTVEFKARVKARATLDLPYRVTTRQGRRAKQSQVRLTQAKPEGRRTGG